MSQDLNPLVEEREENMVLPVNNLILEAIVDQADFETFHKFMRIRNRDMAHYVNRRVKCAIIFPKRPLEISMISFVDESITRARNLTVLDSLLKTHFLMIVLSVEHGSEMLGYHAQVLQECNKLDALKIVVDPSSLQDLEVVLLGMVQRTEQTISIEMFRLQLNGWTNRLVDIILEKVRVKMHITLNERVSTLAEMNVATLIHFFQRSNFEAVVEVHCSLEIRVLMEFIRRMSAAFPGILLSDERMPRGPPNSLWQVITMKIQRLSLNHELKINDYVNRYARRVQRLQEVQEVQEVEEVQGVPDV